MSDPLEVEQPALRAYSRIPRNPDPAATELSGLREYALLLWRKRVTILVVAAICVGATLAYCVLIKPTYQASASVLLEPPISETLVEANSAGAVAPLPDVPDGIEVIESSAVAQLVAKTLPGAPAVTATQVGTTNVVQVSVRSHDPQAAAAAANAYAKAYISFEQSQTTEHLRSGAVAGAEQDRHPATRHRQPELADPLRAGHDQRHPGRDAARGPAGRAHDPAEPAAELPVLRIAGCHDGGGPGDFDGDRPQQAIVAQDGGMDGAGPDLRPHPRHRDRPAGERPGATARTD